MEWVGWMAAVLALWLLVGSVSGRADCECQDEDGDSFSCGDNLYTIATQPQTRGITYLDCTDIVGSIPSEMNQLKGIFSM